MTGVVAAMTALLVGVLATSVVAETPALKVGDPAPAFAPGGWLKGDPVAQLEKGTVYVIEFWASWCGPCRRAIPHLTELQKQYPEVVIIGVSTLERDETAAPRLVQELGDAIGYRIATDPESIMHAAWVKAAGRTTIPSALVVNKEGKIAFIGHPRDLDRTLQELSAVRE